MKRFILRLLIMASIDSVGIGSSLSSAGEPTFEEKEACRAHSTAAGKLIYINRLNGISEQEALDAVKSRASRAKAERDKELTQRIEAIKSQYDTNVLPIMKTNSSNAEANILYCQGRIENFEKNKKQALELKKNTRGDKRMQEIADEMLAEADRNISECNKKMSEAGQEIAAASEERKRMSEEREKELAERIETAKVEARAREEEEERLENPAMDQFEIALIRKIYSLKNSVSDSQLQQMSYEACYKAFASGHK